MRTVIGDGKIGLEARSGNGVPLDPLVPNAEAIVAVEAGRRGELATVGDVDGLMAGLHADD